MSNTTTQTNAADFAVNGLAHQLLFRRSKTSPSGCLEWTGPKNRLGYGKASARGKVWRAHRLAYRLANGFVPEMVCHSCDNPSCVNPEHLFAGDNTANMRDASAKGRLARGERHHARKLSAESVRMIRAHIQNGTPQRVIAELFNIGKSAVADIATGKTWKNS